MLVLANVLLSLPVVGLQDGRSLANVDGLVLEGRDLSLAAFWCSVKHRHDHILLSRDVRFIARDCILINDPNDLSEPHDIVRLPGIIQNSYNPIGKRLVTAGGKKLGRIDNYTINLDTARLQKVYARPNSLRSWIGSSLIVDRNQIVDLTPAAVVVKDAYAEYSEEPSSARLISAQPKP